MKPYLFLTTLIMLLAGCGTLQVSLEPGTPAASLPATGVAATLAPVTPASPTATTNELLLLTNQPAALPTETTQAASDTVPARTPVPPEIVPEAQTVNIYLIALEDNGQAGPQVGCGDSAVSVPVPISPTREVLKAAYQALLSIKQQHYGESGLYNALYQSNLQLDSVNIKDGTAIVYLSGTLLLGGVCDNPRVEAQLEQTALQFSTVNAVAIFINGRPLRDALSLK
jgi:hypothetical protein